MSYFIPRPRKLQLKSGILASIKWPARTEIFVRLVPDEIFGPSDTVDERVMFVQHSSPTISINANNGRVIGTSDNFLPLMNYCQTLDETSELSINGNAFVLASEIASMNELNELLSYVEFHFCTFLSLHLGTYIRPDEIRVTVVPDIKLQFELSNILVRFTVLNEERRTHCLNAALKELQSDVEGQDRYFLSCLYYYQALRLVSPHEAVIPSLNVAELILNLAKCLETLFSNERDAVRTKCLALGYTKEQIESQIVPVLVIRSKFDVAHPVGVRIPYEHIESVYLYAERALDNVQRVLIRIGKLLNEEKAVLAPLPTGVEDDRIKIAKKLREHLAQPALPD